EGVTGVASGRDYYRLDPTRWTSAAPIPAKTTPSSTRMTAVMTTIPSMTGSSISIDAVPRAQVSFRCLERFQQQEYSKRDEHQCRAALHPHERNVLADRSAGSHSERRHDRQRQYRSHEYGPRLPGLGGKRHRRQLCLVSHLGKKDEH